MRKRVWFGRRLWWRVRLAVKDFWCYSGWGSMLVEYCEECGVRQPLYWWSDNALWTELTGHATDPGDNAAGIMCPECFHRRARARGVLLQWVPAVETSRSMSEHTNAI